MTSKLNYDDASKWLGSVLGCHVNPEVFTQLEREVGGDMMNMGDGPEIIPGEQRFRGFSHKLAGKAHDVTLRLRLPIPNQHEKVPVQTLNGAKVQLIAEEFDERLRTPRDVVETTLGILRDMLANPLRYECEFYGVGERDKKGHTKRWDGHLIFYNII